MGRQAHRQSKPGKSPPGRLRIVAGKWRSRLLAVADVPGLRPTPERVRETLFNWLTPEIEKCNCLDLFAGTGALGLEALSRGARSATFVETSAVAMATLRKNCELLGTTEVMFFEGDAQRFLSGNQDSGYDLVFLDPPFGEDMLGDLCRLLAQGNLLSPNAKIYLEQGSEAAFPKLPEDWIPIKDKTAGKVRYSLVQT